MARVVVEKDGGRYGIPEELLPGAVAQGYVLVDGPAAPHPSGAEVLVDAGPGVVSSAAPPNGGASAPGGLEASEATVQSAVVQAAAQVPAHHGAFMLPRPVEFSGGFSTCTGCKQLFTPFPDEPKNRCRDCYRLARGAG